MQNVNQNTLTLQKIKSAFVELLFERDYNQITIDAICKQAHASRTTFYRYFDSKDVLLREIELEYINDLNRIFPPALKEAVQNNQILQASLREACIEGLYYHKEHAKVCLAILRHSGDIYFYQKAMQSAKELMSNLFPAQAYSDNRERLLFFYAAGFVNSIIHWVEEGATSPEDMADFAISLFIKMADNKGLGTAIDQEQE